MADPAASLRSARTVAGGLIASAVITLAIAWSIRFRTPGSGIAPVAYVASALAVAAPAIASVLRAARPVPPADETAPDAHVQAVLTRTVLSYGLLEGAVMFCAIAILLGPYDWPLVAAAIPLAAMVVWFPRGGDTR